MDFDTEILRKSFNLVIENKKTFLDTFYNNLLADYPALRPLFQDSDMEKQKTELARSLVFVIRNINQTERLRAFLNSLGETHQGFGVKKIHYTWLANSIDKTLEGVLGEAYSNEVQNEWKNLTSLIAELMLSGTNEDTSDEKDETSQPKAQSEPKSEIQAEPEPVQSSQELENRPEEHHEADSPDDQQIETAQTPPPVQDEHIEHTPVQIVPPASSKTHEQNEPTSLNNISLDIEIPDNLRGEMRKAIKDAIDRAIRKEVQKMVDEELSKLDLGDINIMLKKVS